MVIQDITHPLRDIIVIFSDGTLLDQIRKGELEIIRERLRFLAELFDEVHVISPISADNRDSVGLATAKLKMHCIAYNARTPIRKVSLFTRIFFALVKLYSHEHRPLIRVYGVPGMLPVIILSYLFRSAKIALSYHYDWSVQRFSNSRIVFALAQGVERLAFRRAKVIITLTDELKARILASGVPVSKIRLVPNWVDTGKFRPGHKGIRIKERYKIRGPFLLYVGRLHAVKNLEMFLRAFARIAKVFDSVSLVVIGDGDQKNSLGRLVSELEISGRVFFTGTLPHEDLPPFYDAAQAFVITSRMEGQPKAVLEAMASGKPIIATDVPGLRTLARNGKNGILVPLDDIKSLVEAMAMILRHPDMRKRMGRMSRHLAIREYSRQAVFAEERAIYFELASNS